MIVHSDESMHVWDSAIMLNRIVSSPMDQALNYYQLMIKIKEKFHLCDHDDTGRYFSSKNHLVIWIVLTYCVIKI